MPTTNDTGAVEAAQYTPPETMDAIPMPWRWFEFMHSPAWMDGEGVLIDDGMIARMGRYAPDLVQAAVLVLSHDTPAARNRLADAVRRAMGPLVPSQCHGIDVEDDGANVRCTKVTWNLSEVCDIHLRDFATEALLADKDHETTVDEWVRKHRDTDMRWRNA